MWPRQGTIIRSHHGLVIRLNNGGAIIAIPPSKKFKLGDAVYIMWDYTTNTPAGVMSDEEYHAPAEEHDGLPDIARPPDWAEDWEWALDC